jgi:16S rRNA (uracil1498-N3)-methyltransferase
MRISRVFVDIDLQVEKSVSLPEETVHYLKNVLRLKNGEQIIVFNGRGGEYSGVIEITKKNIILHIKQFDPIERESPLQIALAQAISHAEHFEIALQKATELGVQRIIPLLTARTQGVDTQRLDKKIIRWNNILRSACEQSGRNRLPILEMPQTIENLLENLFQGTQIFLEPTAEQSFASLSNVEMPLTLVIGAEGGFTNDEIKLLKERDFIGIRVGARILRTETAAIAVIAACQARWGDWC